MNLPNKLTLLRIALVPIMVIISMFDIPGGIFGIGTTWLLVNLIFIIASITDKLDGDIARKRNEITTFGKFMDPLADKILVVSAMLILLEIGKIPAWIPIIIVTREFIVSGYRLIAVENKGEVIAANIWGKIKTVTQIIGIILAFLDVHKFGEFISRYINRNTTYFKCYSNRHDDNCNICYCFFRSYIFKRWKRFIENEMKMIFIIDFF